MKEQKAPGKSRRKTLKNMSPYGRRRTQMENDLIESERRFRAVATSTSDLIWEGDIRNNSLKWFGDIDGCLGYAEGEFPRTVSGHLDNIHPDDCNEFIETVEESLSTGKSFYAVYRIKCKDGSCRHWEERGEAIAFEDGKAIKWAGSITDITDRLRSKEKYKRLSEEFNALLDAIPDDLILLTSEMKIIWANSAFATKFNKDISELYGKHCYQLCCNISSPCRNCPAIKSFKSGKEETMQIMNSVGRILDKRTFPLMDESGKVKNVIEVARDITAKVRMEEESRLIQSKMIHANKMTSLGTLVSGVAHEINNPNSFISHNTSTLKKIWKDTAEILTQHYNDQGDFKIASISFSELQGLVPELLNGINEGSVRIKNIVENLRNFSRPESACLDEIINVNAVIKTSVSILNNHIRKSTDNFHVDCGKDIPMVRGNAQKIEQVVINIIMNSLQSLTDRNCGIRVSTSYDKELNTVAIKIDDDGSGISGDILEQITEPFFTTRIDKGGTGLGLSISYAIIKAHKGSLVFKLKNEKGTTVYIELPAIKSC